MEVVSYLPTSSLPARAADFDFKSSGRFRSGQVGTFQETKILSIDYLVSTLPDLCPMIFRSTRPRSVLVRRNRGKKPRKIETDIEI